MSAILFRSDRFPGIGTSDHHLRHCAPLELLTLSQRGDNSARHCLVARYQGEINALAWRLTTNPTDAEDVSSEAYLRVYRVLNSCRNVDTLPAWVKRITINVFYRFYDRKRRTHESSLEYLAEIAGDYFLPVAESYPEKQVLDEFEHNERLRRLYAAIASLPASYREMIQRYYINSQSYQDIGAQTGLSQGTIKSRLFRAREELQRKLGDLIA